MRTFTFLPVDPMAPPHALQGRVPYSVDAASIGAYRQLVEPWHVKRRCDVLPRSGVWSGRPGVLYPRSRSMRAAPL